MTNTTALPGITNLPLYRAAVRLVMITREVITGNHAVTVSGNECLEEITNNQKHDSYCA
jgi:hypothetical protein